MNKINILIFALLVFACEGFNDPDSPYIEQYVVFANISANKPMIEDTVFVSRTASLDESIDAEELWVSDAKITIAGENDLLSTACLLYTSPSPRDGLLSRMPSSA